MYGAYSTATSFCTPLMYTPQTWYTTNHYVPQHQPTIIQQQAPLTRAYTTYISRPTKSVHYQPGVVQQSTITRAYSTYIQRPTQTAYYGIAQPTVQNVIYNQTPQQPTYTAQQNCAWFQPSSNINHHHFYYSYKTPAKVKYSATLNKSFSTVKFKHTFGKN